MEHDPAIKAALAKAGFRRVARVVASHRVYDVATDHPEVGAVLVRCVPSPTSRDVDEAAEMIAAGDFNFAVVAHTKPSANKITSGVTVKVCSLPELSEVLERLIPSAKLDLPN